ncbi:MAG: tetratricopeptide repeat protein [Candidatus Aminicenantes bacterium]|nr:tetratricopeptide repeat protein [Candidatus Aminicenantes bacterium]
MKIIKSMVVLILLVVSNVYGVVLRGKIVLLSSGGKPVACAQVIAFEINPQSSTSAGLFQLDFPDKKPGDVVMLIVQKEGFEVINKKDLESVVLRQNPDEILEIAMCLEGAWQKNALAYFGIAAIPINEEYDKRRKKIETEIIEGKEVEIRRLTEERDAALAQAKQMSEEFAQVNLDEASDLYKEAFGYFIKGDIDKALEVLNKEKLDRAFKIVEEEKKKAELRVKVALEAGKQLAKDYILGARLLKVKFRFVEAEGYYDKALEADPENLDNYLEFVVFLWNQKNFQKAEGVCNKALSIKMDDGSKAGFLNSLGNLYSKTTRLTEAEKAYDEALEIRRKLAETNPSVYLPGVAKTLNNLGVLYSNTRRLTKAETAFTEALGIYRKLAETNPSAYLPDVAMTLNNWGLLNISRKEYPDALSNLREALNIREKLAAISPSDFDLDLCQAIFTMTDLYFSSPEACAELKGEIPTLLDRAIDILKKYPDNPQALQFLKYAEQLKNEIK